MTVERSSILLTSSNRSIAFVKHYHKKPRSALGIIFLSGFRSDMNGTKALFLEEWCRERKYNFLKFDYSGHGESSENFESGCITDWCDDAKEVLDKLTTGPQILVGSSMGGWIALLLGKLRPERVAVFVGIAAAPDFTENSIWANLDKKERHVLKSEGKIELENQYSSEPYIITEKLIKDGKLNQIMNNKLETPSAIRLLQGMRDKDVHFSTAIKLSQHVSHNNVKVTLVKDAAHQFSTPNCLKIIQSTIEEFL